MGVKQTVADMVDGGVLPPDDALEYLEATVHNAPSRMARFPTPELPRTEREGGSSDPRYEGAPVSARFPDDVAQPPDELETTNRALNRAQTESFAFRLHDGDVLVQNLTYDSPSEHEYRITVREGVPTDCPCPAEMHEAPNCTHRVAVAIRDAVLESAVRMQVATDGETVAADAVDDQPESVDCEVQSAACDCDGLPAGVPC